MSPIDSLQWLPANFELESGVRGSPIWQTADRWHQWRHHPFRSSRCNLL